MGDGGHKQAVIKTPSLGEKARILAENPLCLQKKTTLYCPRAP